MSAWLMGVNVCDTHVNVVMPPSHAVITLALRPAFFHNVKVYDNIISWDYDVCGFLYFGCI